MTNDKSLLVGWQTLKRGLLRKFICILKKKEIIHSDIRKASGFVITTEPLGFVLTKEVNVFLLRVHVVVVKHGYDTYFGMAL